MAAVPKPLRDRVPHLIKTTVARAALHARQIATLQSSVSGMVPGQWETITLRSGWSNTAGFIPAQVRILQNGMSQVIGHIQGGSTLDSTLIGTLDPGFYNQAHKHAFAANAVNGAGTSSQGGTVTSASALIPSGDHSLTGTVTGASTTIPTGNHTLSGPPYIVGPSGTQFLNAVQGTSVTVSLGPTSGVQFLNGAQGAAVAVPVNMNSPVITLDTSGNLTITNVDPNVTQLSFSELIPLLTA